MAGLGYDVEWNGNYRYIGLNNGGNDINIYDVREITKADLQKDKLIFCGRGKIITKVPYICDGYSLLV